MHQHRATTSNFTGTICCEPKIWPDNGIFPVEYVDAATAGAPNLYFVKTIELLWRAVLIAPADQEAYRWNRRVPKARARASEFVGQLTPGALRLFLTSAGVDWRMRPKRPTCGHVACHEACHKTTDEWALSRRVEQWGGIALAARVEAHGDWSACRWPRSRPLP